MAESFYPQAARHEDWQYVKQELEDRGTTPNNAINAMVEVLADALREDDSKNTTIKIKEQQVKI